MVVDGKTPAVKRRAKQKRANHLVGHTVREVDEDYYQVEI